MKCRQCGSDPEDSEVHEIVLKNCERIPVSVTVTDGSGRTEGGMVVHLGKDPRFEEEALDAFKVVLRRFRQPPKPTPMRETGQ